MHRPSNWSAKRARRTPKACLICSPSLPRPMPELTLLAQGDDAREALRGLASFLTTLQE